MRKKIWLGIVLVIILTAMFSTASCSKKQVRKTESTPTIQQEVLKASERSSEQAEQERRLKEDRLQAQAAAREAARTAFINENIHFAFDSSVLSGQAQQVLKRKAEYMRTNSDVSVTVEGHCDERGTNTYNLTLGDRRADSVKDFLVNLGISASRLSTISYGEERPIAMDQTEASWAKNRRAQFVLNGLPEDDRESGMTVPMAK